MGWPNHDDIDDCPHCGCDTLDLTETADEYYIVCRICKLNSPRADSRRDAVEFWNELTTASSLSHHQS